MSFKNVIIICLFLGFSVGAFSYKETESLYFFENNQDYLLIDGVKERIKFNRVKTWKVTRDDILQNENTLKSLENLKKALKNKNIKLVMYGYRNELKTDEFQISSWSFIPIYNLFSYLDLRKIVLDKYNLKYGFKIKGSKSTFNEYVYRFIDSTGDTQFIYIDNIRYTIYFDEEKSNKKALSILYNLKWQIIYAAEKDIKLIGYYNKISKVFILKHWYLKAPFKYIITNESSGYNKVIKKWKFERSHFTKNDYLGKVSIDNPRIYNSSKYFYKKNKVIYLNKRKK